MNHLASTLLTAAATLAGLACSSPVLGQRPPLPAAATRHGAWLEPDGVVRADGERFRAAFDRAHATLEVPPGDPAAAELPRLDLRLLGVARGRAWQPAAPSPAPQLAGDRVRYRHPGVVETYRVEPGGFEQSFEFAARPAGHGDLQLVIGVGGNVQADPAPARHQALEFVRDGARVIRYGEAIAFDRRGDRVRVTTAYDGAGQITLTVPAAFVDGATYPLVVDPAVGPVFNPGGASFNDTSPDVAYDLDNERYMVVWQRNFSSTSVQVRGQIFDEDGTAVTGLIAITSSGLNRTPAVAWCNSLSSPAFLVAWEADGAIEAQMRSGATGNALAGAFAVTSPPSGVRDRRPDVSGPGTGAMMIGWDRTPGGQQDPNQILVRDYYWNNPSNAGFVNAGPERTLTTVAFSSGYAKGIRLAESDVAVDVVGQTWYANRAVWERFYNSPAPGDTDVFTASFRFRPGASAFVILDAPGVVAGGGNIGPDEVTPAIGVRASLHQSAGDVQYCVAWEDEGDVLAHMYDLAGTTGSQIDVRSTSNFEGMPAVGAGHCEFTIAYGEIIPPAEFSVNIRAARVLLDGTVATDDRPVDVLNGPFQGGLRASSRPVHTVDEKRTNTSLLVWWGATGPAGTGLNDIRARFFEPVVANLSPFGSPCPGPAGELPAIGTLNGPPTAGNDNFRFTVSGAPNNTIAALVVSDQLTTTPIPGAPGCSLYAGLPLIDAIPAVVNNSGFGSVIVPIPCSIPHSTVLAFQWGVYTPGWNAFGWIVSDDLDISWSHF